MLEIKKKKGQGEIHNYKWTRVDGYKKFILPEPKKGEYYYVKISTPDIDELTRIRKVEVSLI